MESSFGQKRWFTRRPQAMRSADGNLEFYLSEFITQHGYVKKAPQTRKRKEKQLHKVTGQAKSLKYA